MSEDVTLRAMSVGDVAACDRVFRLAFGTFLQLPDPISFRSDGGILASRLRAYPDGGVVAERDGAIIGLGFASRWGSLGVLGPIAVLPDHWRHGVARLLVAAALETIERWQSRSAGLFTFPQSATHLRLYQEFGFWPRALTPIMAKAVAAPGAASEAISLGSAAGRARLLAGCRALTDSVYAGLDLGLEIAAVLELGLGDVVVLRDGAEVAGFAICHCGAGSEGSSRSCYVKFALVRSGAEAPQLFRRLIAACEAFAHARGAVQLSAGVTTSRHGAYRLLCERGFRIEFMGVAMHRPWQEAYDRPDVFALEDLR